MSETALETVRFAPIDISTLRELNPVVDNLPGARELLKIGRALYSRGGLACFRLPLMVIGAATGGRKGGKARCEVARNTRPA